MIDYMNHRLVCWAEWAIRRDDGGLGWPRQSHYTKAVLSHTRGNIEELNEAAMEMETGVIALRASSQIGYDVVMEFYRTGGSVEAKAHAIGCHKDTLYARLHAAHVWLMNWLQDRVGEHDRKKVVASRLT